MSGIVQVQTDKGSYQFDEIVIATGGISYPSTGSTGDGYAFAKALGHKITDLRAGLCGLNLEGDMHASLQGLALKNVAFCIKNGQKTVFNEQGELLFTHFGVSGPLVLTASSLVNRLPLNLLQSFIDLKPALDEQTLDKRLLRDFEKYKNKKIFNALVDLLPQKLIATVLQACRIPQEKPVHAITKEERRRLVLGLKNLPIKLKSLRGFEEAIITSGGVDLAEINPKTMASKKYPMIKFCGEVLDVDAFTGGFNLQIAFSTGFAAGNTIE